MDNAPSADAEAAPNPHIVEVTGCFGSVSWLVANDLYSLLPRAKRDAVLGMTGRQVIAPFYRESVDKLLCHVGYTGPPPEQFDASWSLETREHRCCHGEVIWNLSQGLWDALPEDQRDAVLQMLEATLMEFFHVKVLQPLYLYARRSLS